MLAQTFVCEVVDDDQHPVFPSIGGRSSTKLRIITDCGKTVWVISAIEKIEAAKGAIT